MAEEFSLRGLLAVAKRINEDPSLVEEDWLAPFREAFELTSAQRQALDDLPLDHNASVQDAFREAAQAVRNGGRLRLRVSQDLEDNRRVMELETLAPDNGSRTTRPSQVLGIICCCADCCCWHVCGSSNPCQ